MTDGNTEDLSTDRLLEIALTQGEQFTGGGNRPIRLLDCDALWYVVKGSVDVFATQLREDGVPMELRHILRAGPGRLLFPTCEAPNLGVLVAKGLPDSELRRVAVDALFRMELDSRIVEQANVWVSEVSEFLVKNVTYRPHLDRSLPPAHTEDVASGKVVSALHGVLWLSTPEGDLEYLGTEKLERSGSGMVPVTALSWVVQNRTAPVRSASTMEMYREGRLHYVLMEFNRLAMRADNTNRALALADVFNIQTASARHLRGSEQRARAGLFSVLSGRQPELARDSVLMRALEPVGRHENIHFRSPPGLRESSSPGDALTLEEILNTSGVRARRITLRHRERWWMSDSGAMLAFRREDNSPVALIPGASGRYRMFDSDSDRSAAVTAKRAATLGPTAYFFYRPFPDRSQGGVAMLGEMALGRIKGDLARLIVAGVLSGLFMLVPALFLGILVSEVLPSGDSRLLAMIVLTLLGAALAFAFLNMLRGTALMRLEGRAAARIGAALWDRLLVLPPSFFRKFSAGDLGIRAMGFQRLRDQISGLVAGAVLSPVFLLPILFLLFLFDIALGVLALSMGLMSVALSAYLGLRQLPHHRLYLAVSRRLTGRLFQLIGGVGKLRVGGAEASGYALWAADYREQKRAEMQLGSLNEHLIAFTTAIPTFAIAALLVLSLYRADQGLTVGGLLTSVAALLVFYAAVAQLGLSFSAVAAILPTIEQANPILEEHPRRPTAGPMLDLQGDLRIDHVSFGYTDNGPLILQDVSLHAQPGEFIALVGESGSGKSTLLRLALGLERPLSGAVYYDGHDLERINWQAVRNSVGMVVQDASLRPQTVLDNIIGIGSDLTEMDAWRAAHQASVDDDIAAMPMGMNTVTSEGSSAFSGGQTQRITLAAALVRNPSVLLLDEATNWLDNETERNVMERIENLPVTRIVSAHRLSTIRRASRIYVLERGRVIQQGTFKELMGQDGVFRKMAQRQIN